MVGARQASQAMYMYIHVHTRYIIMCVQLVHSLTASFPLSLPLSLLQSRLDTMMEIDRVKSLRETEEKGEYIYIHVVASHYDIMMTSFIFALPEKDKHVQRLK